MKENIKSNNKNILINTETGGIRFQWSCNVQRKRSGGEKKHTQRELYKNRVQQNNKTVMIPVGLTLLISQVLVCYNQKIAYPIDTPTVLAADKCQKITQLCASKTDLACGYNSPDKIPAGVISQVTWNPNTGRDWFQKDSRQRRSRPKTW